jgi:hypothetical protein
MTEEAEPGEKRRTGDHEYLWFALLLLIVLTTSVGH